MIFFPDVYQLTLGELQHCPKLGNGITICSAGMILRYVADIFNVMFHPIRKCLYTSMGVCLLRCSTIYNIFFTFSIHIEKELVDSRGHSDL